MLILPCSRPVYGCPLDGAIPGSFCGPNVPEVTAQTATNPGVEFFKQRAHLGKTKVRLPAEKKGPQVVYNHLHSPSEGSESLFPNALLHCIERLRTDFSPQPTIKRESEKGPLPWPSDRAFRLVDRELKPVRKKSGDALQDSFPSLSAADVNVTVVRIPHKPPATSFEFPIQLIRKQIRQKRREWAALRGPCCDRGENQNSPRKRSGPIAPAEPATSPAG